MSMRSVMLVNAQERALLYPKTFYAPSEDELKTITIGDFVKVCCKTERFWCIVTGINANFFVGKIDNDLVDTAEHGLAYGDKIVIYPFEIFTIERC